MSETEGAETKSEREPTSDSKVDENKVSDDATAVEEVIPSEVLENLPEPVRDRVRETFGIFATGPARNPIAEKVTSDHIDKLIDNDEKEAARAFKDKAWSRFFTLGYVLIAIAVFLGYPSCSQSQTQSYFDKFWHFSLRLLLALALGGGSLLFRASQTDACL